MPLRLALLAALLLATSVRADVASLERSFATPPDDAKFMVRWWWFGPAVTPTELEREMKTMKAGGIGGFEVQPTYPLALDGEIPGLKNLKFLSPEFLDALKFTAAKAKELGLRFDLTLGSGWPYGGPMFSIDEAAGQLRVQNVSVAAGQSSATVPALREGDKLIAAFASAVDGKFSELKIRDGAAQLSSAATTSTPVRFFIASHTRMMVKRAAFGAEGYVIDHFSQPAAEKFIREIAAPELAAVSANLPHAVFCDSLEVFNTDWTPTLLAEFQQRRGYDLLPLLPALAPGAATGKSADIRRDWGRTLTELYTEHFAGVFQKWARDHGTLFRIQSYGSPPAALASYAAADLPEGEGSQWKSLSMTRWASSASHLLGRPVTSSETWTWLHSPVFRATPLDMKAEADVHFLSGINQLIAHGWPYTAEGVEYPGWRFYAAAVFDEKNPWWIVMPDVAAYLQRVSYVLRQGQPANDVALYLPTDDAWASFTPGHTQLNTILAQMIGREVPRALLDAGFTFDFFDDGLLDSRGRIDGAALAFGAVRFKTVVLPGVERIPLATMRALEKFAQAGGLVAATHRLPAFAPGYITPDADSHEVAAIAARLFTAPNAPGLFVQDEMQLGVALAARAHPDIALVPVTPEVGFVHRHTDDSELYFIANTANVPCHTSATFRVEGRSAEWWDPMSGRTSPAKISGRTAGGTTVALDLEPFGSRVLVFTARSLTYKPKPAAATLALDLSTGWNVTFSKDSKPVAMETLTSWTDSDATKHFSGVATYTKSFEASAALLASPHLEITFGEGHPIAAPTGRGAQRFQTLFEGPVREAAVVYLNGRRAGSLWHPPYVVDVTSLLHSGQNTLSIEVANLAVNFMAGHPLPDYKALIAKYGDRFQPQEMNLIAPVASGLLGPIKLFASETQK